VDDDLKHPSNCIATVLMLFTIFLGATFGTMVLTALPSFKPSMSMKSNRQAIGTSTVLIINFEGTS
jgi:hypothetical protein